MTAPDTAESDPTLEEAFGELSEAIVASEDGDDVGLLDTTEEAPAPKEEAPKEEEQPKEEAPAKEEEQPEPPPAQDAKPPEPERQPLTYTVDGQQRSFDGAFVLPGLGAVISHDALPRLQDRLQQADRLVAQNQSLYQQTQEFSKLGGRAAYEKLSADKAMLDASATLLLKALSDENTLVSLATDPIARQQLIKEIHLTAREAQHLAQTSAQEAAARDASLADAASRTQTAIHNAVGYLAQGFQGLTEDDITAVRTHASRMHAAIVRPATPDEARQANVQPGSPIIDLPMLHALLEDRHGLRQSVAQQVQRRQTDTLENAARAAAAAPTTVAPNGKTPQPRRDPTNGRFIATPARQETKRLDEMSSQELTRAMKSGRIYDLIGDDEE